MQKKNEQSEKALTIKKYPSKLSIGNSTWWWWWVLEIVQNKGGFEIKTDIQTGKRVVRHNHVISHWPVLSTKFTHQQLD